MRTVIVVGVIVLVLVIFVGLVWLFVRLSRPVAAPTQATRPGRPAAKAMTPPPAGAGSTPRQKKRTRKGKARKRR